MTDTRPDLLQGTLDLLILQTLTSGPLHGWGISKRIRQMSEEALQVNQGSLYPALYRLEDRGWILGEPGRSPEGRAIRLYRLSAVGRRQLQREVATWQFFATAVNNVLRTA